MMIITVSCIWIACKYYETRDNTLTSSQIVTEICGGRMSLRELLTCESFILQIVDYKLFN
jgi:hypothetical protein